MWYVVQTISGQEEKCMQLCKKRLDTECYHEMFVPCYIVKRHYHGGWHDKKKILFPGYFFADTEQIEKIVDVLKGIPQFARVLKSAGQIAPVAEREQEFLKDMMDEQHIVRHSEGFLIGDRVCIMEGPLKNWEGLVRRVDRHRRIAYLDVNLFDRMTPMEVGFSAVAKLTEEEFQDVRRKNRETALADNPSDKMVRIISGIFEGMTGKLLYTDEDRDEWAVELKLFGEKPSRVVFRKDEIDSL